MPIAEEFLRSIGSDVYNIAKKKIINILSKKKNPKLVFQFKSEYKGTEIVIKAQTNDKEELSLVFDTIDKAREIAMGELEKKRHILLQSIMITVGFWILKKAEKVKAESKK